MVVISSKIGGNMKITRLTARLVARLKVKLGVNPDLWSIFLVLFVRCCQGHDCLNFFCEVTYMSASDFLCTESNSSRV